MNKLVSINILTYNGENFIESCLKSVLNQTYANIEILIIDNASADNTLSRIRNQESPASPSEAGRAGIRIIENKKNLGFSAGHNLGIKESRGEYVLCLNQDVVLDKDFVKYAVEALEKDEKIGSVQPKLLKGYNIIDTTGLLMFKNRRVVNRGQGEEDKGQFQAGEIFGVDGAAPIYRRVALENTKINNEYFDEDFFCYKEDIDLAWRMRLYGWKAFYEPKAVGYHLRSAGERAAKNYLAIISERRKVPKHAKFCSFKNQRLLQIKNELPSLFFRDFFSILIKEMGAWLYVLIFEYYIIKVIKELFRQVPSAFKKRKIIMANKKINNEEMKKWIL